MSTKHIPRSGQITLEFMFYILPVFLIFISYIYLGKVLVSEYESSYRILQAHRTSVSFSDLIILSPGLYERGENFYPITNEEEFSEKLRMPGCAKYDIRARDHVIEPWKKELPPEYIADYTNSSSFSYFGKTYGEPSYYVKRAYLENGKLRLSSFFLSPG